jgi:hypothetical protein
MAPGFAVYLPAWLRELQCQCLSWRVRELRRHCLSGTRGCSVTACLAPGVAVSLLSWLRELQCHCLDGSRSCNVRTCLAKEIGNSLGDWVIGPDSQRARAVFSGKGRRLCILKKALLSNARCVSHCTSARYDLYLYSCAWRIMCRRPKQNNNRRRPQDHGWVPTGRLSLPGVPETRP